MKKSILFLLFATCTYALIAQTGPKSYEYKNGSWYNGAGFTNGTWYVVNNLLTKKAPSKIDSVVDLQGRWVVPPQGDAFSSCVADNSNAAGTLKLYMEEGVFYLQVLGNTQEGRTAVTGLVNKPNAPDAVFANGAITCSLGYPFLQYEGPAQGIRNPAQWGQKYDQLKTSRKMLGNGYWFIDNKDAFNANWEKIKAQKPGLITIYLVDAQNSGGKEGKGLDADVAKLVVKKAHKADLRVFAYAETPEDVRLGLKIGVDGFANMPGHNWDGSGDPKKFELADEDVKKLAKKKIPVATLFSHAQAYGPVKAIQDFHTKTLKRLMENDVNLILGSDDPQRTNRAEMNYWFNLGSIDYGRMLKVICENTPRAIFPNRKIGKIEEGYEASFLALLDTPLDNIMKLRAISFKVKNGVILKSSGK
jgi:hypothetical protein